jgi:hypothetical protein
MHPLHRSKNRIAKMVRKSVLARAFGVAAAALGLAGSASAIDFGPFSLTGFAKVDVTRISSKCEPKDCQVEKFAGREFIWSDELVQGVGYGAGNTDVTLFQPYLGVKFDLPQGFKLSGLLSQRWRDGKEDFKGFWYDRNAGISHEDYGSLRIGAMTTRAWSMADFPFGIAHPSRALHLAPVRRGRRRPGGRSHLRRRRERLAAEQAALLGAVAAVPKG